MEWLDSIIDGAKNFLFGGSVATAEGYASSEPDPELERCVIQSVAAEAPGTTRILNGVAGSDGYRSYGFSEGRRGLTVEINPFENLRISGDYNGAAGDVHSELEMDPVSRQALGGITTTSPVGSRDGVTSTQDVVARTFQRLQHCLPSTP